MAEVLVIQFGIFIYRGTVQRLSYQYVQRGLLDLFFLHFSRNIGKGAAYNFLLRPGRFIYNRRGSISG